MGIVHSTPHSKAIRRVDHGLISQSDDDANAGHGHEAPRDGVVFCPCNKLTLDNFDFFAQGLPGAQKWFDNGAQRGVAFDGLAHAHWKSAFGASEHDDAECLHEPAQGVGDRLALRDQLSPRHQQHAQRAGIHAFDRDLTVPAGPNDLGKPLGVVGVGLVDLHL
jgi:hypothetical protein